jgi:predicted RND superfamily exporter protein
LQKLRLAEDKMQGLIPIELSLVSEEEGRFYDPDILNAVDDIAEWVEEQPGVLRTQTFGDYLHEAWAAYTGDPAKSEAEFQSRAQVAQLYSLIESAKPDPTEAYLTFDRQRLRLQIQIRDLGGKATMALVDELRETTRDELSGIEEVEFHVTGDGYSAAKGVDFIMRDMLSSLGLAFVIIFFIMTFLFKSVRMGLISVPPNVIPLILTLAYMSARGIYLNSTTAIIFSVSLGLAVDDTIHYLARFREEVADGLGRDAAIFSSAGGTGRAILVTTIMLASGQLVLLWSSFVPITLFSELISVTLISCLFGDLIVLPALLHVAWKPKKERQ